MLISELEAKLKELREEHGDLPVYFYKRRCDWRLKDIVTEIKKIEYKSKIVDMMSRDLPPGIIFNDVFRFQK